MSTLRIKICGITTSGDAQTAARFGADLIGLNFYERSPRFVAEPRAAEIMQTLSSSVEPVAVLVEPTPELLERIYHLGFRTVQLHAADPATVAETLAALSLQLILAHGVDSEDSLKQCSRSLELWNQHGIQPAALLVDAKVPGLHGGTGQTAPWHLLAGFNPGVPVILAGGLSPDNVAEAVRLVRPLAVDVAGGVEFISGIKDADKIRCFIEKARK